MGIRDHLTPVVQRDKPTQIVPLGTRQLQLDGIGLLLRGIGLLLCGNVRRLTGRNMPEPGIAMSLRKLILV
ncbi:hypothetical protein GCM10009077_44150 [Roseibium denhamense]